jgi:hypothetical protein
VDTCSILCPLPFGDVAEGDNEFVGDESCVEFENASAAEAVLSFRLSAQAELNYASS